MKICMVAHTTYESDNRVMRYAETLVRHGHEVDVISLGKPGKERVAFVGRVRVIRIQKRGTAESLASYPFRILAFLLRATVILGWRHMRCRYDLIHVHSVPDFLVFSALVPKITGTKVILDIHDVLPEFFASKCHIGTTSPLFKLLLLVERASTRFADHVLIANHIWQEKLSRRSVPPGRITTIQNTPDRNRFVRRGRTRPRDGKTILVYPGSLNSHQGVDVAIRAMPSILREVPRAELHVYGRGGAKDALLRLKDELGLHDSVFIHSELPAREIVQIIENADIGVEPKRATMFSDEAFSTKIFEYMAMGVPAVASSTRVHRYYLDSSLLMFFPDGDFEALADCVVSLVRSPELQKQYVRNGLEYLNQHDWQSQVPAYLRVVETLAGANRARTATSCQAL